MRHLYIMLLATLITAGAGADSITDSRSDARLDRKVTLEISHAKLEDVCRQLTEMTGITIKAGSGERDWKVRERRVTIQARDMKLGTLMQEISRLLGFYLSRSGKEGEWAYLYWQDKKSRDLEAELLNAEKEAAAQRTRKLCQSAIDKAAEALKLSPDEARKLREKDPLLAYMGGTKSGRGFAQLLSSLASGFPTEIELMMRGQRVTIPMSQVPLSMHQAALDFASGGLVASGHRDHGDSGAVQLEPYQLTVVPLGTSSKPGVKSLGLGSIIALMGAEPDGKVGGNPYSAYGPGRLMGLFTMMDPKSGYARRFAESLFALDEGANSESENDKLGEVLRNPDTLASMLQKDSPTEKDPPTDPRLTREVEISNKPPDSVGLDGSGCDPEAIGKSIAQIAEALGMPVVLESFPVLMPPTLFIKQGKQSLYKVLVGIEKADMDWELSDDALRIRPRDWALRRSYEISEGFMAHCRNLLETQGELTLDDLGMIATSLTDEQISSTLLRDPDLGPVVDPALGNSGENRSSIRFYGSLADQQKAALKTESGLPFTDLTDGQWERMCALISDRIGGLYVVGGSVSFGQNSQETLSVSFRISVQVADETEPRISSGRFIMLGKERIAEMKKQRQAEEDRKKAAEEKQGDQRSP